MNEGPVEQDCCCCVDEERGGVGGHKSVDNSEEEEEADEAGIALDENQDGCCGEGQEVFSELAGSSSEAWLPWVLCSRCFLIVWWLLCLSTVVVVVVVLRSVDESDSDRPTLGGGSDRVPAVILETVLAGKSSEFVPDEDDELRGEDGNGAGSESEDEKERGVDCGSGDDGGELGSKGSDRGRSVAATAERNRF